MLRNQRVVSAVFDCCRRPNRVYFSALNDLNSNKVASDATVQDKTKSDAKMQVKTKVKTKTLLVKDILRFDFSPSLSGSTQGSVPESPVPIVFLGGEYLSSSVWSDWSRHMSRSGYSGLSLSLSDVMNPYTNLNPSDLGGPKDLYQLADNLQLIIETNKLMPPLLIAHSFSCHLAQKFLESYPLRGLIMIDPLPPRKTAQFIQKMASSHEEICKDCYDNQVPSPQNQNPLADKFISKIYRTDTSALFQSMALSSDSKDDIVESRQNIKATLEILHSIANRNSQTDLTNDDVDKATDVLLEPGSVPMLICLSGETTTKSDGSLKGGTTNGDGNYAKEQSRNGLVDAFSICHGLEKEDFVITGEDQKRDDLIFSILQWINIQY